MRDPKRIKRILELIEKYWNEHTDLRLTQVLVNTKTIPNFPGHWYYLEDDEVEKLFASAVNSEQGEGE